MLLKPCQLVHASYVFCPSKDFVTIFRWSTSRLFVILLIFGVAIMIYVLSTEQVTVAGSVINTILVSFYLPYPSFLSDDFEGV